MNINPPQKVRFVIYVVFGIAALVATYLVKKSIIGVDEVTLFTGISAFVFGLAGINTIPTKE